MSRTLREVVSEHASRTPDAPAILAPGRRALTYAQLEEQVRAVVGTLNSMGIGRNDRVAMVLSDGPEMAVGCLAISAGATVAPLNPALRQIELEAQLTQPGCKAVVIERGSHSSAAAVALERGIAVIELAPELNREAGRFSLTSSTRPKQKPSDRGFARAEDLAIVLPTSGTAATPRLVPLTHANVTTAAASICDALELTSTDRCLNVMPLFHIHGLSTLFSSIMVGASVVCIERYSAEQFFRCLDALEPTWYSAAPTIHRNILEHAAAYVDSVVGSTLRLVRSASAAMPDRLIADMEKLFRVPFVEAYGMTEAGPQIASNGLTPANRRPGSVGRPAGPEVMIIAETGEIAIRGANLMNGYLDDAEANDSAFVQGWLRTGDLGRLDQDGFLFITGRLKEVINRGGEKVSPSEVEAVLMKHPAITVAVSFPVPHPSLGEDVAAAIVIQPGREREGLVREVRQFAAVRLADFKVPQVVMIVDEIPHGPTGKVLRRELASQLGLLNGDARVARVMPRSPVESRLAELWAGVLKGDGEGPGIHDNFFEAGGDSLKAAQLLSRVHTELHIELPAHTLFERPTVAELAELVGKPAGKPLVIPRRTSTAPAPLSFAQQRLWFLDQVEPGDPAYNMALSLRLSGAVSVEALERSLGEILRRHESLRTTFHLAAGQPVQVVGPVAPIRLPVVDLSRLPEAERAIEAHRLSGEETARPFHLVHGPLFRAQLLKLGSEEHVLLATVHHIVSDGWSTGVFCSELSALYEAFATERPCPLAEPAIQYGDFAAWQRQRLSGIAMDRQMNWWQQQLAGMPPVLELPSDRPRPAVRTNHGATHSMEIPANIVVPLTALGRREGATPFMTLLAAFQVLLRCYTGQDDVVVGTPIANRTRPETEDMIGFFANTLVMRTDLSGRPTFLEALRRVRSTAIGGYRHQDLPFERLVEELHPDRSPGHNPLFQVMFAFQNLPAIGFDPVAGLTITPIETARSAAKFDLTLYVSESGRGLSTTWLYNSDLFDRDRIARMAEQFRTLLAAVAAHPGAAVQEHSLLSEAERRAMLELGKGPDLPTEDGRCFHQLFEEQVSRTPRATAVRSGDDTLSYHELNRRANVLARRLRDRGVGPEVRVGILLPRSADTVVAVLAVMKAGGAWLALDPSWPTEHLGFMLEDAAVAHLLTLEDVRSLEGEADNLPTAVTPESLAYAIYTSGSTGRSKGVLITHGNLTHYVRAMGSALGIRADDRYLHTASFAFSSSVRQLTLPLSSGACVVIASAEQVRDPDELFRLVEAERITVMDVVPSYWRACNQIPGGRPTASRLRLVLSASEPLHWHSAFRDGVQLVNMFGQTETTGIVTIYPVPTQGGVGGDIVPIGRPIAGTQVYVLDSARQPVPLGVWGELFIGGAGIGRGYLHEPELNQQKFGPDPFQGREDTRLYKTGDIARFRGDGVLEFKGRVDHQLKLYGYRIEPGQIEAVIARQPGWLESAVVAEEDGGGKRLVAYVVPDPQQPGSVKALKVFLREQLPDYMLPSRVVETTTLPRTPTGKLDRSALGRHLEREPDSKPIEASRAEAVLSGIWCELLAIELVNPDDNWFDLGGNSMLSIRMIHRARQAGLRFTPAELWQHQTIGDLADLLSSRGEHRKPAPAKPVRVTIESLRGWGQEALEHAGLGSEAAAIVTEVQLEASLRNQPTHHIGSIPRYAKRLLAGTINPRPNLTIERRSDTSAHVDGDNGPGQWVAVMAMREAIRIAGEKGLGVVGVRRSNHLGAAGHYPWLAAQEGLIGLCTTNGPVILAPTGGVTPTFGNNPLAVGIPAGSHHPILLDVAMSVAPRGRIGLALAEGERLPPGWILDQDGNPSTDPADLVAGLGVPIGGHKGYGLTLVMEVLAGVLTGANFGWENRREHNPQMNRPAGFGHFFLAIDPALFQPAAEFRARIDRLIEQAKGGERAAGVEEILVPGERELRARERSLREGVSLRASTYQALLKYARSTGLHSQLEVLD